MDIERFKFRAWDKKNKKMLYQKYRKYLCVGDCGNILVEVEYVSNDYGMFEPKSVYQLTNPQADNLVIMQCTGLRDKNGKLIFEGDYLKDPFHKNNIGLVIWSESELSFRIENSCSDMKRKLCISDLQRPIIKEIEIIGNVFENKELLEANK